jgi:phosphatidylserine decarboxylase
MVSRMPHQYIDRATAQAKTESLFCDAIVNYCYCELRESASVLFNLLSSARVSHLLGYLNFDLPLSCSLNSPHKIARTLGIVLEECVAPLKALNTPRALFERQIRYWDCRPTPPDAGAVVSPADAKVLVGSFSQTDRLFLKNKFFCFEELFGADKYHWHAAFENADFAVFRLTPDKYHYNHTPVAGRVVDIYEIPGGYHSCNPGAVVAEATPYSKNKRVVTVIDTDVDGGDNVGLVAMIEIVALMIGDIQQCYSDSRYDHPRHVAPGMMLRKGCPKSLYRPGSSVDVLVLQKGRIVFSKDIVRNMYRNDAQSRFSAGFGRPLVETDVQVRSEIARGRHDT